jgi:hypothetical protein
MDERHTAGTRVSENQEAGYQDNRVSGLGAVRLSGVKENTGYRREERGMAEARRVPGYQDIE